MGLVAAPRIYRHLMSVLALTLSIKIIRTISSGLLSIPCSNVVRWKFSINLRVANSKSMSMTSGRVCFCSHIVSRKLGKQKPVPVLAALLIG